MPFVADETETTIRALLIDVLGVAPATAAAMTDDTPLFGALPELDSMAVAGLLTEMEDRLDIMIDDDDVDGDLFESFGSLVTFAKAKVGPQG
jgi:acyl carrier protein